MTKPKNITPLTRRDFILAAGFATLGLTESLCKAAEPSSYQLGCYTRPWDKWDYKVALDGIAQAGFKYAGIMTANGKPWVIINPDTPPERVQEIAREVQNRGLKTLSIYGGDFPVQKSVSAGIAGLQKLIDHCKTCECPNLLLGGTGDEKLQNSYYQVVSECCDYAGKSNVVMSIKPHGGRNATGPECRAIIEKVAHKNFRLWYDPGNIFYYSEGKLDPVDDSKTVGGLVVGMSVKDFKLPKEVLVTPGTGLVRFEPVLRQLAEGGFKSGPLVVECLATGEDPAAVTREARKAREFLTKLVLK